MSPKEINRASIAAFLTRCIGHGWAQAIDAEHGLRICNVSIDEIGNVEIELDDGHTVFIAITHLVSRTPKPWKPKGDAKWDSTAKLNP